MAVAHQVTPLASCCAFQGHYHKQGVHHGRESLRCWLWNQMCLGTLDIEMWKYSYGPLWPSKCGQGRLGSHLSLGRPRCPPSQHPSILRHRRAQRRGDLRELILGRFFSEQNSGIFEGYFGLLHFVRNLKMTSGVHGESPSGVGCNMERCLWSWSQQH